MLSKLYVIVISPRISITKGGYMATHKVMTTELREKTATITQGLRAGDKFVLIHYKPQKGYITPKVPKELLSEAFKMPLKEGLETERSP
jgi:hypothetical protein